MAGNVNKVILMGNLTRDVELKYTPGNQAVAKIGLAVNRRYTTGDGEKREETTFIDCESWGKQAEIMAKYLSKGRPVFIEGRLKLDSWQDKESGEKRSKLKVVIESFQFVDSRGDGEGGGYEGDSGGGRSRGPARSAAGAAPKADADWGGKPIDEDDIPF